MKNRIKLGCSLLMLVFIITGCNDKGQGNVIKIDELLHNATSSDQEEMMKTNHDKEADEKQILALPKTTSELSDVPMIEIEGKIRDSFYAEDNLFIVADKLYLYDFYKDSIVAESDFPVLTTPMSKDNHEIINIDPENNDVNNIENYRFLSFLETDDGYVAIIDNYGDIVCIFYDKTLKENEKIYINQISDNSFASTATVSGDGEKIAFHNSSEGKLYLYDLKQDSLEEILDTNDSDKVKGLVFFKEIYFASSEQLIFIAGSNETPVTAGAQTFSTIGSLDLSSGELINLKPQNYSIGSEISVYEDFTIIPPDFFKTNGTLLLLDNQSGDTQTINLGNHNEGKDGVFGSSNGEYFATATSEDSKWIIKIYQTSSQELITEKIIEGLDENYFANRLVIQIFDKTRSCVVSIGTAENSIESKIVTFNF